MLVYLGVVMALEFCFFLLLHTYWLVCKNSLCNIGASEKVSKLYALNQRKIVHVHPLLQNCSGVGKYLGENRLTFLMIHLKFQQRVNMEVVNLGKAKTDRSFSAGLKKCEGNLN